MILTLGSDKQEEDGNVNINQSKGNNTMKKAKGKTRMMGGGKAKKSYKRGGKTTKSKAKGGKR